MTSPDATAPLSHPSSHFLSCLSFQKHLRTSGVNQTTPAQSQDPKHVTHHVVKHQRLISPSSRSGAMPAPALPHQPSFGMRPEQLSSGGEQGLLSTVLPGARPFQPEQLLSLLEDTQNSSKLKEAGSRWMAGFCLCCFGKKDTFSGSCECRRGEGLWAHISAHRDKGKNNPSTTQSCSNSTTPGSISKGQTRLQSSCSTTQRHKAQDILRRSQLLHHHKSINCLLQAFRKY